MAITFFYIEGKISEGLLGLKRAFMHAKLL